MKRDIRVLLILAIVFFALVAALLMQEDMLNSTVDPTPTPEILLNRVFPELAVRDILAIQMRVPGREQALTLIRDANGLWTAPELPQELDTEQASRIAQTMSLLPYFYTFEAEGRSLEHYGFADGGAFLIQLITTDNVEHVIAIGDIVEEPEAFYAIVDDRPEIYLLNQSAVAYLMGYYLNPPVRTG